MRLSFQEWLLAGGLVAFEMAQQLCRRGRKVDRLILFDCRLPVTASPDGTVIEDDVFIGSDTQLVAPVTVRRGATIGAPAGITTRIEPSVVRGGRRTRARSPRFRNFDW